MDFGYSDTLAEWGAGNSLCGSLLSFLLELRPPLQHTHMHTHTNNTMNCGPSVYETNPHPSCL